MYTKGVYNVPSSQVKYLKLLYMMFLLFLICCGIINLFNSITGHIPWANQWNANQFPFPAV